MYLNQQRNTMRAGLKYKDHDHEKAAKCVYTVNNLMIYLTENVTNFTREEMCRNITPVMLKPRTQVEYVKMDSEDLVKKQDVVSLFRTISRGIECKIDVGGARKRTSKYKSGYGSSSKSNSGRDADCRGGGRRGNGKNTNMCRIPDHNHVRKDCPNNRWSRNYEGPSSRNRDSEDNSKSRSRSPPGRGAWHCDRDRD